MSNVVPIGRRRRRVADHHFVNDRRALPRMLDRLLDAWPLVDRFAKEMGRGYPASSLASGSAGGGGDVQLTLVESIAARGTRDPSKQAEDWLERFERVKRELVALHSDRVTFLPLTGAQVDQARARQVSIEICAAEDCAHPERIIADKVKRIDGQPYHATSCYFRVWRARKAS